MSAVLRDADARRRIVENLHDTLFVEAGAGSGKTTSLVDRIVATVLDRTDPVPLSAVAAVTFTDKAAAELRSRLRAAFEQHGTGAEHALDDLDTAAIGTLHSFAQRILTEHPIEAGLPPLIEILDEVGSGVAFDDRWTALRTDLLDDPDLTDTLLLAMGAGMRLTDLRSLAATFTANWDLIADRVLAAPPPDVPRVDVAAVIGEARRIVALRGHCRDTDDKMLDRLDVLAEWTRQLASAPDDPTRVDILGRVPGGAWRIGRAPNWQPFDLNVLRADGRALAAAAIAVRDIALEICVRRLAHRIGRATLADADARRAEGRLEFHDLLVLARNLLRHPDHGPATRAGLHARYRRILLDEFQDTDPIQVELAVRIAGGTRAGHPDWTDSTVPAGRLFIVGDPKQSIYRFRRANIATYLRAQQHLGDAVTLDVNFRTAAPIIDWINTTFGRLVVAEPGSQPTYRPLHAVRPAPPAGPPVTVLGPEEHTDNPDADELRTREADDVAAAIRTALHERWQVADGDRWRDARLDDIAVLVPARTSLPHLEKAFDEAGIGYQSAATSLVYRTREVRDLLTAVRAVDDPSDALALVTALRSPLFGCGDDDLWTWHRAGGRFHLLAPLPITDDDHPVRAAITYLRGLHRERVWLPPSAILSRVVDDRRMYESAATEPRRRDIWRRLRFVVDQARAFSDTEHTGLRAYLAWATRQGSDTARVAESVLPETDTDSVRVMTVHAAKGLEFPIVILTGMTSRPGGARSGVEVLWPDTGGYELRLRQSIQTGAFDIAKPIDEQMDHHERIRLLYVACTRARDHLVVSTHRKTRTGTPASTVRTSAEILADAAPVVAAADLDRTVGTPPIAAGAVAAPPTYATWNAIVGTARAAAARASSISAAQLEGTTFAAPADAHDRPVDPGHDKKPRDLELPPWNKGRYGTAIGRAVHGVLQSVDLATGRGLDDAVAAQALAEDVTDHSDLITTLATNALNSDIVRHAAGRPHWRETYAATTIDGRVLEGIIDLLYRDDDGLVIVDYKTDAVPAAAIDARVAYYRPQMAAYAATVEAATGTAPIRCYLLFINPTRVHVVETPSVPDDIARVREALHR